MKLIVGLGNPGTKYAKVRHNLGFMVLDEYAKKHLGSDITWQEDNKFKAEMIKLNPDMWLIKPQTYMNNSGLAVQSLAAYYKLPTSDIIVIHDDLDIPLGKMKIRQGGSGAGHHGVESVVNALSSDQFIRVRLGIGTLRTLSSEHGGQHMSTEQFVLEPFTSTDKPKVKQMLKKAVEALDLLLEKGLEITQNQFN